MNYKTTIGLIVLLAVVGAYVFFVERDRPAASPPGSRTTPAIETDKPLFTADELSTESINRVTIQRGDATWVFAKEGADWWQVEPVRFKLSSWASSTIVDKAASLRLYETLKEQTLDNPFATVTLSDASGGTSGGKTFTLKLGDSTISGRAKAVRDDSDRVLLVSDALHTAVRELDVNDLRARTLDAPGPAQADTLTVNRPGGEGLSLHKSTNGLWYLDAAHTQRAATAEAERIINAFARLGIDQFIADAPQRLDVYGLDEPRLTVTLTTPDRTIPDSGTVEPGERITLKVGRTADLEGNSFFAVRTRGDTGGNVVFTVTKGVLAPFEKPAAELRDPAVFTGKLDEIRVLAIARDGVTLRLERDAQRRFNFAQPTPGYGVDYSEATALIEAALALKATAFDPAFEPAGEPAARVTLNDATVALYPNGESYWALRNGEHVAYSVAAADVAPLLKADAPSLRDRTVLDLVRSAVIAVTLTRPDNVTLRFTRGDDEAWSLEGHEAFEREAFAQLLTLLAPLRAERWLGTDAQPGEIVAELRIETKDGPARTLAVGSEAAFVEGIDEAFAIGDALRNRVTAEYRPRALVTLLPEDIASITREHAGESRTVTLANNQFRWNSDEALNTPAAAALFEALAGLKAERFVTHQTFAAEQPAWTFTITPTSGGLPFTLKLMSDRMTATLEPASDEAYRHWFTLDAETVKKLTAPLSERDQPLPNAEDLIESK